MKRTPWFPVSVKPARKGEYEVKLQYLGGVQRRRWNGHVWVRVATYSVGVFGGFSGDKWRGLTKPAKGE